MTKYAIGLGSNLGDRLGHMRAGARALEELGSTALSAIYETEPVGGPEQGPYLNAVVLLETDLEPADLLRQLHRIEAAEGRVRQEHWGARTLDLDIISSDGPPVSTDDLNVPHPRAGERVFVLKPLVDVWPDAPVGSRNVREALAGLGDQGVERLVSDWVRPLRSRMGKVLVGAQMALIAAIALVLVLDGTLPTGGLEPVQIPGSLIVVSGAVLAVAASRRLGPAMTPFPEPTETAALVLEGPYRYVRHPIYGGVAMVFLGVALVLGSVLGMALSAGLFVLFYVKSTYEERLLRLSYSGYRDYRSRVPRRFVPFLF